MHSAAYYVIVGKDVTGFLKKLHKAKLWRQYASSNWLSDSV